MLLGVDHLRNTLNIFRQKSQNTSFTIVNITSDSGFEGPQSSLNNLPDFCSISSCEGYTISSKQEANQIIHGCLSRPKFSIISISQRLFHTDIIKLKDLTAKPNSSYFKYLNGKDLVIVCLNFSLPQGLKLSNDLKKLGISCSLFNISASHPISFNDIIKEVIKVKRLVIIDDSKSYLSISNLLETVALKEGINEVCVVKRNISENSYYPNDEVFDIDVKNVINKTKLSIKI